jgi:epoxyqueuosine reductase QueG
MEHELSNQLKSVALAHGADLVGIVKVSDLPEHAENITRILPSARYVIVVASPHNVAALRSDNNQAAQFDTIYTYGECEQSAHKTTRYLVSEGFPSVAVPAFIPIDMAEPKKGMQGEICWRRAGVKAGLGSFGENGLLITKEFGSAIRLAGLLTSAPLKADEALDEDFCDHCMRCLEVCPVGALSEGGKINKKLCGDHLFAYGLRCFTGLFHSLAHKPALEIESLCESHTLRELWQTFMTGNYYYCFKCQSQCPATKAPRHH